MIPYFECTFETEILIKRNSTRVPFQQCMVIDFSKKGCFMTAVEGAFKNSINIVGIGVYRARAKKQGNLTCCKQGFASFKCAPKIEEESVRLAASIGMLPDPLAIP